MIMHSLLKLHFLVDEVDFDIFLFAIFGIRFVMTNRANNHNKYMPQAFNMPIARFVADFTNGLDAQQDDDHQLEKQISLCVGK